MLSAVIKLIVLISLSLSGSGEKARYDNYRVYEVFIENAEQLNLLREIEIDLDGYRIMDIPSNLNSKSRIIVPPHKFAEFSERNEEFKLKAQLVIKNLQELANREHPRRHRRSTLDWTRYWTNEEISSWLMSLPQMYPDDVTLINIGNSYEKRPILGIRLNIGGNPNKKSIVFEGAHHSKEWISPATVTWMLNELLVSKDPEVRKLAETYEWHIIPVTNPDGYTYTWTHDRYWRKTRQPVTRYCKGADPNRNWDNHFNESGTSSNPCRQTYPGHSPFSEPEIRQLSQYLKKIQNLVGYFSFHAYGQILMVPYGYTKELLDNYQQLYEIGLKAIEALKLKFGTEYKLGSIANTVNYIASGASMDWVKHELKANVTFEYEMRDTGYYGFSLLPDQIIPNAIEVFASIITILQEAQMRGIA